jgi:hypothetical protein
MKDDAPGGERVEEGRQPAGVAESPETIGPQRVDHDHDDIRIRRAGQLAGRKQADRKEKRLWRAKAGS